MPNKSQPVVLPTRADLIAACAVAAFVGLLGLWPHLGFIREIGEFRYFQGAYDEDSYILSWLLGTLRSTRALSGFALSAIYAACSTSLDATLIASDFVFPFLATCAAYFAASQIVSGRAERVLVSLLLVFANDLFSLGNLAIWTNGRFNIFAFSQAAGIFGSNLVPPYETSFLAIFRTPEPQVSFTLMFLILGLLARLAVNAQATGRSVAVALIAALALLPLGYTFVTAPVAVIAFGSMLMFAICGRREAAIVTAIGLLGAVSVVLITQYWVRSGGQSTSSLATGLSYHSRVPIITPAVLWSLSLGTWLGIWMLRRRYTEPLAFLALGCLIVPFVLSNQQLISGVMISARDWERNVSYPLLVFGATIMIPLVAPSADARARRSTKLAWLGSILCIVIVLHGQSVAFRMWKSRNIESMAMVHVLDKADPALLADSRLTFGDIGISQFIQVRMKDKVNVPLSFYKVAMHFIPNMAPDATQAEPSPYESLVFEFWLRTGVSPEQAEHLLRTEVGQRAGTFTNYLFSFRDAWYPASDNRAVRQADLERSVEPIITRYRAYLRPDNRRGFFDQSALLISTQPPTALPVSPWIRNDLIASESVRNVAAYLYRQSPP